MKTETHKCTQEIRNIGASNMVHSQQQQQQGMNQSVQQLLMSHNYNSPQQRNNTLLKPDCQSMMRGQGQHVAGRNYNLGYQESSHELSTSPVSNQLARWFSPELLAQARAGKLPGMPAFSPTQNMLSVEELERLQQAVHN
ncbi:Eukaryotic translation initiation factor 4E [Homalodisca vitripennis]|nr:Eukaryotic translation initiation factor 4E [Homalodisca vitripennis]